MLGEGARLYRAAPHEARRSGQRPLAAP